MAATAWSPTNHFKDQLPRGAVNFPTDTVVMRLYTSASDISDTSTTASTVTGELATGNGYTAGGQTLAHTVSSTAGTTTLDCDDAAWTATGGSITARYAGLADTTANILLAWSLLDDTPADVTVTDGNTLTVQVPKILDITG